MVTSSSERRPGERGVLREPLRGVAHRPAALVLEFLRQVPVIERGGGRDPVLGQLVKQGPAVGVGQVEQRPAV